MVHVKIKSEQNIPIHNTLNSMVSLLNVEVFADDNKTNVTEQFLSAVSLMQRLN